MEMSNPGAPHPTPAHSASLSIAPAIETARLTLHGHRLADFPDCAAMWADPEVTRHIGGKPLPAEEVWAKLLRNVGHWALLGFGYWVARERGTGRFVGEVGFMEARREITPSLIGAPEHGWALARWAHGQGFATEAVGATLAWVKDHLGPRRTVCLIDPDNAASIHVAAKCGYREFAQSTYKGAPTILFERLPSH